MPKNVMKLLKPSPHRGRNDFDLSHRHVFDANFGELLPATCIETVPGDNITLHASDLLRAIPFVSSPFLRAKQHLDVWFVPYQDLWHNFNQFITKREEPVSSAFKGSSYCPWFTQYDLHQGVETAINAGVRDVAFRTLDKRSYYLLQLLGYGEIDSNYGVVGDTFAVNPFRLAAYNYIWYNEYRQQYYDDGMNGVNPAKNAANLFNFDDLDCTSQNGAHIIDAQTVGAMCQMRYRTWKKDLFTGVLPSTQFGNVSTIDAGSISGISAAFVGSPSTGSVSLSGGNVGSQVLNPDGTPMTDKQPTDSDARHWTFENVDGSAVDLNTDSLGQRIYACLKPGVSGQVYDNGDGTYDLEGQSLDQTYAGKNGSVYHYHHFDMPAHSHALDTVSGSVTVTPQGTVNLSSTGGSLEFDVLALRKAEAIQIWRENALRAGNHVKDNMMAHYGVESDFRDHRPTYLGSVSAPLSIGDITTTANSSSGINNTVGDIAGKGTSALSEKVFKFHAKDFGVIMVMFSLLPEAEYDAYGIERNNQLLEAEDFFVPEYENLGLEAVSSINVVSMQGKPSQHHVFGYAPRYYGYKTKLDKVFGAFIENGIFRTWSSQRTDVVYQLGNSGASVPLTLLYVNPLIFDTNFNVGIDVSPEFMCDLYFDVDAVRPMSVVGLPFS